MAFGNHVSSSSTSRPGLVFAAQFLFAAILAAGLMINQHDAISAFARTVTIPTTSALGNLLGLTITSNSDILSVNGFAMRIIDQCTAFNYVVILALAILLYTQHTLKYRLEGVAVATLCVLFANAVRLLITGMVGNVSLKAFHFVHEYLWVTLFALLVFGIWKVWADRKLNFSWKTARHVGTVAIGCSAVYLLLIEFREQYCQTLASLAEPLFKLILGDSQASLVWNGSLQFTQGVIKERMGLFFEMANIAVYAGIMLPYILRNRKAIPLAAFGMVLLIITYAEFIGILGVCAIRYGKALAEGFQFIGSGVFLALPMALYWMMVSIQGKKHAQEEE